MGAHRYKDPYSNKIKSSRYHNRKKEKDDLIRLLEMGADKWFPWPVGWSSYDRDPYNWRNNGPSKNAYPKRYWRPQCSKYYKTLGHRTVRRNKKMNVYNTTYNKAYEYWWQMW